VHRQQCDKIPHHTQLLTAPKIYHTMPIKLFSSPDHIRVYNKN